MFPNPDSWVELAWWAVEWAGGWLFYHFLEFKSWDGFNGESTCGNYYYNVTQSNSDQGGTEWAAWGYGATWDAAGYI